MEMSEDKCANIDVASKDEHIYEDAISSQDSRDKTKEDATSKG